MEKAIICKWGCPSCGNIITTEQVLVRGQKSKMSFEGPTDCSCGRKGKFELQDFVPATAKIVPDSEVREDE